MTEHKHPPAREAMLEALRAVERAHTQAWHAVAWWDRPIDVVGLQLAKRALDMAMWEVNAKLWSAINEQLLNEERREVEE